MMSSLGEVLPGMIGDGDGDPDVPCYLVPGSLAPIPWSSRPMLQALFRMYEKDGEPFFGDSRTVLERAMAPIRKMGLGVVMATELEFYLLDANAEGPTQAASKVPGLGRPQPGPQVYHPDDLWDVEQFLNDLYDCCDAQGIPADTATSEFAPAQFEINLQHVDDPVLACDHAVLLKRAVKATAARNGLGATFMAKPFADIAGNGLHIHVSLLDESGANVFAGESRDGAFSDRLRHAIGGLGALMTESMAIFAPNANSYRRHAPGSFVPASPTWGANHRGVAMRIPLSGPANTRLEHRVAGADANPYLVVAAVLAGIHHGLSESVEPGPMIPEGAQIDYQITVPVRWPKALDAFDAGEILVRYIGADYRDLFSKCRREEEGNYNAEIPTKDFEWYLRAV
jgi:glutamine synthetase